MTAAATTSHRAQRDQVPTLLLLCAAVVIGAVMVTLVIRYASYTFAYDYRAYDEAARRVLTGGSPYDLSYTQAGPFGLFYYPPTSIFAFLPFTLLSVETASWIWIAVAIGSIVLAIAILPVRLQTRSIVLLLAGISWPVLYAVKIGQVGPLLFLTFAVAWRWLDRPVVAGIASAIGTALKLQPGIVLVWMALTGRWRMLTVSALVLIVLGFATTVVLGINVWHDFATIVTRVGDPVRTANNFTPGAVAYQLGVPADVASLVQIASMAAVVVAMLAASRFATPEASFLVVVVASQLLSPILWDHYALMLLLPVAWLIERRQWWAVLIPLSQSALLVGVTPAAGYVVAFAVVIAALLSVGRKAPASNTMRLLGDPG